MTDKEIKLLRNLESVARAAHGASKASAAIRAYGEAVASYAFNAANNIEGVSDEFKRILNLYLEGDTFKERAEIIDKMLEEKQS